MNEIQVQYFYGRTVYARIYDPAQDKWWNVDTAAWEAWVDGNVDHYAVSMSPQGSSGFYTASTPDGIDTLGGYTVPVFEQLGDAPLLTDPFISTGILLWSGMAEVFMDPSAVASLAAIASNTALLPTGQVVKIATTLTDQGLMSIRSYAALRVPFAGLGNIIGRSKLWFTLKTERAEDDAKAILQVEETLGLTILNGNPATHPTDASLTVDIAASGAVTLRVQARATAALAPGKYVWDVKVKTAEGAFVVAEGIAAVAIATNRQY